MRPIYFTYAPTSSNATAVCAAQTIGGAGNLVLNGSLASGGVVTLGDQQHVLFTSTSNLTTVHATITGTDKAGNALTETVTLPNISTAASTKNFYKITQIAVDGAIAANLSVGVNGLGESQPIPLDVYLTPFNASVAVTADAGPATYKAQYTYDDVFAASWPNGTQVWFDSANMTGKTAGFVDTLTQPARAVRFAITAQAASQSLSGVIVQAGGGL